jgi:hypothetical protein
MSGQHQSYTIARKRRRKDDHEELKDKTDGRKEEIGPV